MSISEFSPMAIDVRVLRVLAAQDGPIGSFIIYGQVPDATTTAVEEALNLLYTAALVDLAAPISSRLWIISPDGLKKLAEIDAEDGAPGRMRNAADSVQHTVDRMRAATGRDPLQVSVCSRTEPEPPATGLLCVDEDELDDWWETLDIDQKADAFAGFSLRMYAGVSHVYVERSIPVAGTIGEAKTTEVTAV